MAETGPARRLMRGKGGRGYYAVSRNTRGQWIAKLPKKHLGSYLPVALRPNQLGWKSKQTSGISRGIPLGVFSTEVDAAEAVAWAMQLVEEDPTNGPARVEGAVSSGDVPWAEPPNRLLSWADHAEQLHQCAEPIIMEPSFVEMDPKSKRFRGRRDKPASKARRLAKAEEQRKDELQRSWARMNRDINDAMQRIRTAKAVDMKETIHNEAKSLASGHTNTGDFHFFTDMLTATECASRKSRTERGASWKLRRVDRILCNPFAKDLEGIEAGCEDSMHFVAAAMAKYTWHKGYRFDTANLRKLQDVLSSTLEYEMGS